MAHSTLKSCANSSRTSTGVYTHIGCPRAHNITALMCWLPIFSCRLRAPVLHAGMPSPRVFLWRLLTGGAAPLLFSGLKATKSEPALLDEGSLGAMGIFTAISIFIHNFPEGLATSVTATKLLRPRFASARLESTRIVCRYPLQCSQVCLCGCDSLLSLEGL